MAATETALWLAVIERAFSDAIGEAGDAAFNSVEARRWIMTRNDDFDLVCQLAGIEPHAVRVTLAKRIDTSPAAIEGAVRTA